MQHLHIGVKNGKNQDVLDETCCAWRRKESPAKPVEKARAAFRRSMNRRNRGGRASYGGGAK